MTLDPNLAATVVKTAGSLIQTVLTRLSAKESNDPADKVVERLYDVLRPQLTDTSVRCLVAMESGRNMEAFEIRERVFPKLQISPQANPREPHFDQQFEYRLKFLCLLGLAMHVGAEYAITKLGVAFINAAKSKRDYYNVFWPEQ